MNFPKDFTDCMHQLLKEEADSFFKSFHEQNAYGLRMNPLKFNNNLSAKALPFSLTPIAWAREGFYAVPEEHPGKHPLHEGGAYYIQEPSAMSVVSLLDPKPGDFVCDLCAAPGGKSTQIAGRLLGEGLLVSNEIFPARAKILSQNIERFGVGNCVVCNEPPDKMAAHFPLFFHKIVVDAPCSGEGMFRKDENAIKEWSLDQVEICRKRQQMILECADQMLAPGGVMVYSTCTFSPEEDEKMVAWFLSTHPDYELEDWRTILPTNCGLEGGKPQFTDTESIDLEKTLRLWPHKLKGEGHFAARLKKSNTLPLAGQTIPQNKHRKNKASLSLKQETKVSCFNNMETGKKKSRQPDISGYLDFTKTFLNIASAANNRYTILKQISNNSNFQYFGDELYLIPEKVPSLKGIKITRAGLHLGTRKKNRFEPAHALAMALSPNDCTQSTECSYDTAIRYLHGETIPCSTDFHAWTLICYQGISLGWGKAQNGILKNHYPKGMRTPY